MVAIVGSFSERMFVCHLIHHETASGTRERHERMRASTLDNVPYVDLPPNLQVLACAGFDRPLQAPPWFGGLELRSHTEPIHQSVHEAAPPLQWAGGSATP